MKKTRNWWKWAPAAALALMGGCSESSPMIGEKGGPCRVSYTPCDGELKCVAGECATAPDEVAARPLDGRFRLEKARVKADGEDSTRVEVFLNYRDDASPFTGKVRLWMEPETAGVIAPIDVELDEEGRGLFLFRACDGKDLKCPDNVVFRVADWDNPLEVVATSSIMALVGGNPIGARPEAPDGPTGGGGSGLSGLPSGFSTNCPEEGTAVSITVGNEVFTFSRPNAGFCAGTFCSRTNDDEGYFSVIALRGITADGLLRCMPGEDRQSGRFAVPAKFGLSVAVHPKSRSADKPWLTLNCERERPGVEGTGSGSSTQVITCDRNGIAAYGIVFDSQCEGEMRSDQPGKTISAKITGCIRYKRQ